MGPSPLDGALTELKAALDEIGIAAAFVAKAIEVQPRLGRMLQWDGLSAPDKHMAQAFMDHEQGRHPIYEGLIARSVATFEWFLRRCVRDTVRHVNEKQLEFDRVSLHLRDRNRHCAGRALTTIYTPSDSLNIDFDALCRELGTCVPGSQPVSLSADVFAAAVSGMSVDRMEDVFVLLGARLDWDRIGAHAKVKAVLKLTKPREAAAEAKRRLKETQRMRNQYAHMGPGPGTATGDDVANAAAFLEALATAFKEHLGDRVLRPGHFDTTEKGR